MRWQYTITYSPASALRAFVLAEVEPGFVWSGQVVTTLETITLIKPTRMTGARMAALAVTPGVESVAEEQVT